MPVRRVVANEQVDADRDRVAFQRGPIVFAAEWVDNPKGKVRNIVLPDTNALSATFRPDLLRGVRGREGARRRVVTRRARHGAQVRAAVHGDSRMRRGPTVARGQMAVWLARTDAAAKPTPYPTIASESTMTTSRSSQNPRNINDGEEPSSSNDSSSYFDWWPNGWPALPARPSGRQPARNQCSQGEWVEMTFANPATVSEAQVYWFDDHGARRRARARPDGGCSTRMATPGSRLTRRQRSAWRRTRGTRSRSGA